MKPAKFKEANATLYGSLNDKQTAIEDLPVFKGDGQIISLWELSRKERFEVFFRGKVWVHTMSIQTQPPINLQTYKTPFGEYDDSGK